MSEDSPNSSDETKQWAGGVHVAAFLLALFTSWSAGIGVMIAAMVVWVVKKDESAYIRRHAAEAFNFNLSMFLYSLAFLIIWQLTDGILFLIMLPVAALLLALWFVCPLMAYKAARNSQEYRYPMTLHLLK